MRQLKFAGFKPGTRVRAYDFEPREGLPARYAEGVIQEELDPDAMRARGLFPCYAYRIAVDVDTTCTEEPRTEIFAPLEVTFEWDGRIQEVPRQHVPGGILEPLPTDYCPQCCVVHVTCECPREDETYQQYWRRMDRLAAERAS